jgi:hypothetical protein
MFYLLGVSFNVVSCLEQPNGFSLPAASGAAVGEAQNSFLPGLKSQTAEHN